jgi:acyl-CoA thioester hydrolase
LSTRCGDGEIPGEFPGTDPTPPMSELSRLHHATSYRVIYRDTDLAGHMYYGNYLALFEIGRGALLRSLGGTYADWERRGYILPVRRCEAEYLSPAFYDDVLSISTRIMKLTAVKAEFAYRIRRSAPVAGAGITEGGGAALEEVICTGMTVHPLITRDRKLSRDLLKLMAEVDVTPAMVEAAGDLPW